MHWCYPIKVQHRGEATVHSGLVWDYSDSYPLSTAESWGQGLSAGICYSSTKFPQTYVWKFAAAIGTVAGQSSPSNLFAPKGTVLACMNVLCSFGGKDKSLHGWCLMYHALLYFD